jgi:molybdenum-dependent DNA-binding transcriptional regulator ModE
MAQKISWRLSLLLVAAFALAGGYWYRVADSTCPVPLMYSIGMIDERFGLSKEDVQKVVAEAEALWEDATGRDLFASDPQGVLAINFIYDDRQQLTVDEHKLRNVLDRKEDVSSTIKEKYEDLLTKYEKLKKTYEERVRVYENKLATHNGEVAYWNNKGGAPEEVYARLNEEQGALDKENKALSALTGTLNGLVDSINKLGEQGNKTVQDYNSQVAEYNDRFNHEREFTEGEYYNGQINIYQFKDIDELRLVLAHELGHSLSLGHVEDSHSVMYYLMDKQPSDVSLSIADLAEFARVCGE